MPRQIDAQSYEFRWTFGEPMNPPVPLILRRIRIDHQVKLLRGAMLDRDGVLLRRALCFRLRP